MRRTHTGRALVAAILAALAGACGGGGSTQIINVTPTITVTGTTVETGCLPGAPTIQANGVSTCNVTLDLTLDPPIANFLNMAVSANGPAGATLYSTTNTATEPIASGTQQRLYSVSFDSITGAGTLDLYLRSTVSGAGTLTLASGSVLNQPVSVSFAVDTSIPATLSIAAQSFVAAGGGYSDVTATVLNALSNPLQNFTITFTHDDPNGRYCVPTPCSGATLPPITAVTDVNGEATARFSTTDTARHDVVVTVQITGPTAYLSSQSTTITAFDSKTEVSKIEYVVIGNGGQSGDTPPAGVDAFYGATAGVADVLQMKARARSIDEVTNGDCNCDAATDTVTTPNCTDALERACPVSGQVVEIACPTGLTNPSSTSSCKFAYDLGFTSTEAACTLAAAGSCVRFTCPAGTPCVINDFYVRIVSASVAAPGLSAPVTFPDSFFESITPKTKVSLSSGTPNPPADRCDDNSAYVNCGTKADPTIFLPDPDLAATAVFTKPLTADGLVEKCQVLGAGNDYFRCSDVSTDYLPNPPALPVATDPRMPFRFVVKNVLDDGRFNVTFPANTYIELSDSRAGSAPQFRGCDGTTTCNNSAAGLVSFPDATGVTTASTFSNFYYYPRFGTGTYNLAATVKVPTQAGFLNATQTLMANPECDSPVQISCLAASGTGAAPATNIAPNYFGAGGLGLLEPMADGYKADFVTCTVKSFGQVDPGGAATGAPFNCPASDTDALNLINASAFSVRALANGDAEVEKFCPAGISSAFCDASVNPGNYSGDLKLTNQVINAGGYLEAQFYVMVDSAVTATATFSTDFTARVIQDGDTSTGGFQPTTDPANDLAPAALIEQTPTITMDRDSSLAKDVVLTFFKADAVTSAASIYAQTVITHAHGLDIRNQYALNTASGETDPFAARVNIQVRDYNNNTYIDTNGAHPNAANPLCTVQIAPNGGQNTKVGAVTGGSPGTCQSPSTTPISKVQTTGSGTIDNTICMISDGTVSAATGNATLQATLSNCGSGSINTNLTVNSVLRGAKFPIRIRNLTATSQSFRDGQMNLDLDTTVFCKNLASPCANTAQYLGVTPDAGTFTGTRSAVVLYAAGPPVQVNGTAEETTCSNTFVVPASGFLPAWTVDLSIAPDAGGGTLAQRVAFSTAQADTAMDTAGDSKFTFKQFVNWAAGCGGYTFMDSNLAWDAQPSTALFVGGL